TVAREGEVAFPRLPPDQQRRNDLVARIRSGVRAQAAIRRLELVAHRSRGCAREILRAEPQAAEARPPRGSLLSLRRRDQGSARLKERQALTAPWACLLRTYLIWHRGDQVGREKLRIEGVAAKRPVFAQLARVGEPGDAACARHRWGSGAVLRLTAKRGKRAVEGRFLQRLGEQLELVAILERCGCTQHALDERRLARIVEGAQGRAACIREPALRIGHPLRGKPLQRRLL